MLDRAHLRVVPRIFEDVTVMRCHERDGFGDVEGRAAAETDHGVGVMVLEGDRPAHCLARDGVAPDVGIHGDVETGQVGDERFQHRQRRDAAIGDDQRAFDDPVP